MATIASTHTHRDTDRQTDRHTKDPASPSPTQQLPPPPQEEQQLHLRQGQLQPPNNHTTGQSQQQQNEKDKCAFGDTIQHDVSLNNHEDSYEDGRKDDDEGDVSVQEPMVGMMMVATMHMMMSIRSRKTHANYDCLGDYQVKEADDIGVHAAADHVMMMMMTTMIMTMVTMTITTLVPVSGCTCCNVHKLCQYKYHDDDTTTTPQCNRYSSRQPANW